MQSNFLQELPAFVATLGGWTFTALRIVGIVVVAWLVIALAQRAIRGFRARVASRMDDAEAVKRAETLGRVFRYLVAVVVWLVAGMLVLSEIGISVAPILGAAGVAGLAIGFGAQSLVKDYFNGFFLLLENQIRQGDIVQIADHSGSVEDVTLRYVRLRDYDGNVHFVPNGEIRSVINMSRDFAQAVVNVGVAYSEDIDRVTQVMFDVAQNLRKDEVHAAKILDDFELAGVDRWDDSAVVIRGRFRTAPSQQWGVRREYLKRLKAAFDAHGIEIPFPQMTLNRPATIRDRQAASNDAPDQRARKSAR